MSCTSSGHKWGAGGRKGQEIPQGSTDGDPLGAGAPYSSKRPQGFSPACLSGLLPAEGTQSLCLTSQGKLSLGALPFSRELEAGGDGKSPQEEP